MKKLFVKVCLILTLVSIMGANCKGPKRTIKPHPKPDCPTCNTYS